MTIEYAIISAALSDIGRKRTVNEDSCAFFEPDSLDELERSGRLYIVADGVGGADCGEYASQYACKKVLYDYFQVTEVSPEDRLREIMMQANRELHDFSIQSTKINRMATTMVAIAVIGNRLIVANVGDSRAYLIRGGRIRQLTEDHSEVHEMVRQGLLTPEQAQHSANKNKITRSIGGKSEVKVDVFEYGLQPYDRILLCTDGITRYVEDAELAKLASDGSPAEVAEKLIATANERGGADNSTVITFLLQPAFEQIDLPELDRNEEKLMDWETQPFYCERAATVSNAEKNTDSNQPKAVRAFAKQRPKKPQALGSNGMNIQLGKLRRRRNISPSYILILALVVIVLLIIIWFFIIQAIIEIL